MGGFPGFPRVPKVPRRKFHGLRAFGAFGTKRKGDQNKNKFGFKPSELPELPHTKKNSKRYAKIQVKTLDEIYAGERERKKAKKAKKVKVPIVPVVFSDYYI